MAFNPALPVELTLADAAQMRSQFNGLFDLIQAIPVGPQGPQGVPGPAGPPFTSFAVDGVTTLDPGQPATVTASFDGTEVTFDFGIPQGAGGPPGPQGIDGPVGPAGAVFTDFEVGGVNTLDPSFNAYVEISFNGTAVEMIFGIPQGITGATGPVGPAGPMGEVTSAQLNTAIAGTPSNTNAIATLDIPISDPPTQSEVTQVLAKLNELIAGLRRP